MVCCLSSLYVCLADWSLPWMLLLLQDDEIEEVHEEAAQEGQSEQIAQGEVDTHFVCFVEKEGHLYELDGRKSFPINHGPRSAPPCSRRQEVPCP